MERGLKEQPLGSKQESVELKMSGVRLKGDKAFVARFANEAIDFRRTENLLPFGESTSRLVGR